MGKEIGLAKLWVLNVTHRRTDGVLFAASVLFRCWDAFFWHVTLVCSVAYLYLAADDGRGGAAVCRRGKYPRFLPL